VRYEMALQRRQRRMGNRRPHRRMADNHTPPSAVLFVPDVPVPPVPAPAERSAQGPSAGEGTGGTGRPSILIGSYVSEGTAGLAWVDLEAKSSAAKAGSAEIGPVRRTWRATQGRSGSRTSMLTLRRHGALAMGRPSQ